MRIPYLMILMNGHRRYTELMLLGQGSCGRVTLAINSLNQQYAIKEIDTRGLCEDQIKIFQEEALTIARLDHPNIIRFKQAYINTSERYCIVMEYASGGTLYDRIHEDSDTNLPETKIVEWLCQLCLALRYLHKKGVLHRDIKSQNIFLTGKDRIKIGDFGISKILGENRNYAKSFVGTPFYIAPEIILKMPYSHKCDMWSLGVLLYQMCCRTMPFKGYSLDEMNQAILSGQYPPVKSTYSKELIDIIQGLICSNPNLRLSANDVLNTKLCRKSILKFLKENKEQKCPGNLFRDIPSYNLLVPKSTHKKQSLFDCKLAKTIQQSDEQQK